MTDTSALHRLEAHGIRPSMQRLAVMDYLLKHCSHPTVDEVYTQLAQEMPTLSRTTVYNTLRLLTEQGAALMLTIDEHQVCYDACTEPHAHFLCTRCGRVSDVPLPLGLLRPRHRLPQGYALQSAELDYRGLCPECNRAETDPSNQAIKQ